MTRDRYQKAQEIFSDLFELPPEKREAALLAACGRDEDLRRDVNTLLAADANADEFMNDSLLDAGLHGLATQVEDPQKVIGTRVGAYQLTSLIGAGGMGGVYLGERVDDEFKKIVAVKLLHADLATDDLLNRFQHERQILSDLEHANIARLYDGGVTDTGRPYIVMEYIEGSPIDVHCDHKNLDVAGRIRLLQEMCRAVQHAHRNLVVHRDLKPSNILVDARGRVKLLDFGIAEALDVTKPDTESKRVRTFTPRYASPEQSTAAVVTTASDVFSIGVILRKLLTGETDGDLSALPIDLSAIITRATQNDPEQRYHSVEHLADDLTRHLTHLPVNAVTGSFSYISGKFLRRNRAGAFWATSLAVLLIVASLVSLQLAIHANEQHELAVQRFEEVRELATTFLFEIHDAVDTEGPTAAREKMVATGLTYLDVLNTQDHHDPDLARDIARGYFKIASLQGDPSVSSLGDPDAGLESCNQGMAIVQMLVDEGPFDQGLILLEAQGHLTLGNISRHFDDLGTSRTHYEAALTLRSEADADAMYVPRTYVIHKSYARTLERAAAFEEAIEHYELAQAELVVLTTQDSDNHELRGALISTRVDLGQVHRYSGQADQALAILDAQIPLLITEIDARPEGQFLRAMLGGARLNLGRALDELGQRERAGTELESALILWDDLIRSDPLNVTLQLNASSTHHFLGRLRGGAGEHEAALAHFQQMLEIRRSVALGKPESLAYRREVATALDMTGSALRQLGRVDEALALHQEANRVFLAIADERPDDVEAGRAVAVSYYFLGQIHDGIAESEGQTQDGKLASISDALRCYRASRQVMQSLDEAGLLAVRDQGVIEMLDGEIRRCEGN